VSNPTWQRKAGESPGAILRHILSTSRLIGSAAGSRRRFLIAATALGVLLWLWPARSARSDNFVFYLPNNRQLIPVQTLDNVRYLPLLRVLNLVGTVSDVQQKRHSLRILMGTNELELHEGERKLKLNRHQIEIEGAVRVENGEWMVPLDFLYSVLPRLTSQTLAYRAGDERMFVGDVQPLTFSTRLTPMANGSRLTIRFSGPVTVETASTNGQYVIFLGGKALQPLEPQIQFKDQNITGLAFDDQDGVPKLIITPAAANLNFYPSVADGGRTFEADVIQPAQSSRPAQSAESAKPSQTPAGAASQRAGAVAGAAAPPQPATSAASAGGTAAQPAVAAPPPLPVIVLDAGHGGADAGARSRDGVTERDLMATLVDRVRGSLTSTGKVRVILTREGSNDPTPDERDVMTNLARPAAFLTFHAGDLGGATPAAEVYTYQEPSTRAAPAPPQVFFVPWTEAQQAHLMRSRDFAASLTQEFGQIEGLTMRSPGAAPVRQLRSIDAPGVAVELGTLAPNQDAATLASAAFQDQVAKAVADTAAAFVQGAS
jgi:N-acetylmuramoyl-L-alanine amidase